MTYCALYPSIFRTEATTFAEQIDASSFITLPAPELSPSEHKVGEVSYVATDKCCPFGPRQSSAREEGWNAKHSCRSHNRNVDGDERSFHGDRFARNQHRQPKNDCNIIDTAAQRLPTAISRSLRTVETIVVISSGLDVPIAT